MTTKCSAKVQSYFISDPPQNESRLVVAVSFSTQALRNAMMTVSFPAENQKKSKVRQFQNSEPIHVFFAVEQLRIK